MNHNRKRVRQPKACWCCRNSSADSKKSKTESYAISKKNLLKSEYAADDKLTISPVIFLKRILESHFEEHQKNRVKNLSASECAGDKKLKMTPVIILNKILDCYFEEHPNKRVQKRLHEQDEKTEYMNGPVKVKKIYTKKDQEESRETRQALQQIHEHQEEEEYRKVPEETKNANNKTNKQEETKSGYIPEKIQKHHDKQNRERKKCTCTKETKCIFITEINNYPENDARNTRVAQHIKKKYRKQHKVQKANSRNVRKAIAIIHKNQKKEENRKIMKATKKHYNKSYVEEETNSRHFAEKIPNLNDKQCVQEESEKTGITAIDNHQEEEREWNVPKALRILHKNEIEEQKSIILEVNKKCNNKTNDDKETNSIHMPETIQSPIDKQNVEEGTEYTCNTKIYNHQVEESRFILSTEINDQPEEVAKRIRIAQNIAKVDSKQHMEKEANIWNVPKSMSTPYKNQTEEENSNVLEETEFCNNKGNEKQKTNSRHIPETILNPKDKQNVEGGTEYTCNTEIDYRQDEETEFIFSTEINIHSEQDSKSRNVAQNIKELNGKPLQEEEASSSNVSIAIKEEHNRKQGEEIKPCTNKTNVEDGINSSHVPQSIKKINSIDNVEEETQFICTTENESHQEQEPGCSFITESNKHSEEEAGSVFTPNPMEELNHILDMEVNFSNPHNVEKYLETIYEAFLSSI